MPKTLLIQGDDNPGFRRAGSATAGFRYLDLRGRPLQNPDILARIRSLAIPPAYRDVWISPLADSHLQATGIDARGRKQYRYHPRWRELRDAEKFRRMLQFAKALPALRRRVARDMMKPALSETKVVAAVVALLEASLIRVGNEEYARDNHHYGLTTLRERHVTLHGEHLRFHFTGKSGVERDVQLDDKRLAKVVKGMLELPGQLLFKYRGADGRVHPVHSDNVNAYLHAATGEHFTAKDFRTWAGTVFCAVALTALAEQKADAGKKAKAKATVLAAVKEVAARLGNTPAVSRKSYIHPVIIDEYLANGLQQLGLEARRALDYRHHLHHAEGAVLTLLEGALQSRTRDLSTQLRNSIAAQGKSARTRATATQSPRGAAGGARSAQHPSGNKAAQSREGGAAQRLSRRLRSA